MYYAYMNTALNIKIIVGSTRPNRFSEKVAPWLMQQIKNKNEISAELLDLRDYEMPFFEEPASPTVIKKPYRLPAVSKWSEKIQEADGYIIITPEYNHGYSAVLKNALDYIYYEWNQKAVGFVSYGGVSGARAIEQLRQVAIELQMAPVRSSVHIPSPWGMLDDKGELKPGSLEPFNRSAENLFTQLIWWARALKNARQ